jgi:lipoprotein
MKKLSLLAMLTVLVGSALFVTSCGGKVQADSVWQVTDTAAGSPVFEQYVYFGANGKMIVAQKMLGTLTKISSGDYTAKNGKIKAPYIAAVECDYKISGETMTISKGGAMTFKLKKVSSPTAKQMKAL